MTHVLQYARRVRPQLPDGLVAALRLVGAQQFTTADGTRWEWSAFKTRYVRTAAGARRYGLPIGSPIVGKPRKPGGGGNGTGNAKPKTSAGGARVKLTPAQRDAAERHLGTQPGAGRGAYLDGNQVVVEDRDVAVKALDDILANNDLTPGQRKARKNLRDKIASQPGGGQTRNAEPDVSPPEDAGEQEEPAAPATTPAAYRPAARRGPDDWADDTTFRDAVLVRGARGEPGDRDLAEVWARQGFDGKPTVLSSADFDALPDDHVRIYRGVEANDQAQADQWAEDYRSGDNPFAGAGVFGNGTYTATDRDVAESYATAGSGGGHVMDMALRPDARVIDYDDLLDESNKFRMGLNERNPAMLRQLPDELGVTAAALGYDAVRVPAPGVNRRGAVNGSYFIVMNRTALFIREDPNA